MPSTAPTVETVNVLDVHETLALHSVTVANEYEGKSACVDDVNPSSKYFRTTSCMVELAGTDFDVQRV